MRSNTKSEELDIKIAIENHGDVNSTELIQIVEKLSNPNIGICFDLGNTLMTFEDPLEAADKTAPYIVTTHFKDYKIQLTNYGFKVVGVAPGKGNIDLGSAYRILTEKTNLDRIILEIPVEAEGDEKFTIAKEDDYVNRSFICQKNFEN